MEAINCGLSGDYRVYEDFKNDITEPNIETDTFRRYGIMVQAYTPLSTTNVELLLGRYFPKNSYDWVGEQDCNLVCLVWMTESEATKIEKELFYEGISFDLFEWKERFADEELYS